MALDLTADAPAAPDATDREWLLDALAELIAQRGADAVLAPPVAPGPKAFPERWRPTRAGVTEVARRCAAHAGLVGVAIDVVDGRGGIAVDPKQPTELDVDAVTPTGATLALAVLGRDDVAGTSCHAIGAVIVALGRLAQAGPFRSTEEVGGDDDTRRRGSVAAVWAGLGVLAANAAYQQYTDGTPINGYAPVDYRVVRAGAVPMSAMAFLVAVQAELRGAAGLPDGLNGPQRDEARAWRKALAGRGPALRARLGIPSDARGPVRRPPLAPIAPESEDAEEPEPAAGEAVDGDEDPDLGAAPPRAAGRTVFRVIHHAGGIGTLAGMLAGGIAAAAVLPTPLGRGRGRGGGGLAGFGAGRRRVHARCADCDIALPFDAASCPRCKGVLGRVIRHRNDRLDEAERDSSDAA